MIPGFSPPISDGLTFDRSAGAPNEFLEDTLCHMSTNRAVIDIVEEISRYQMMIRRLDCEKAEAEQALGHLLALANILGIEIDDKHQPPDTNLDSVGGETAGRRTGSTPDQICSVLSQAPGVPHSIDEIMAALKQKIGHELNEMTVRQAAKRLADKGVVVKEGSKYLVEHAV